MSYRHTLEATIENLHEIEDLIRRFPENGGIPSIEIDLVMQKLRNIYELMVIMQSHPPVFTQQTESVSDSVADHENSNAVKVTIESKKDDKSSSTSVTVEENTADNQHYPEHKTEHTKTVKSTKTDRTIQTLADQFTGRPTLLESLNQTYSKEIRTVTHKPVKDLMSAIGINDRFTFIRELFENNHLEFENTINTLNNAPDFEKAREYLSEQFSWDMESEPVQLLLEIVRRKYL